MVKICRNCEEEFETKTTAIYCENCREVSLICKNCGKEFKKARSKYQYCINNGTKHDDFYCSNKCQRQKTYSKESCKLREENKRKNGFYSPERIQSRYKACLESGGFDRFIAASHSEEAEKRREKTKRENGYYENIWPEIKEKGSTKETRIKQWETKREKFFEDYNLFMQNMNISFNEKVKEIQLDYKSILSMKYPGVWALWGVNIISGAKECLTAGQTSDLSRELSWVLRVLKSKKMKEAEEKDPGCTGGWYKIQSEFNNYQLIIINEGEEDFNKREELEMNYAVKNNAILWKPSVTQFAKWRNLK